MFTQAQVQQLAEAGFVVDTDNPDYPDDQFVIKHNELFVQHNSSEFPPEIPGNLGSDAEIYIHGLNASAKIEANAVGADLVQQATSGLIKIYEEGKHWPKAESPEEKEEKFTGWLEAYPGGDYTPETLALMETIRTTRTEIKEDFHNRSHPFSVWLDGEPIGTQRFQAEAELGRKSVSLIYARRELGQIK